MPQTINPLRSLSIQRKDSLELVAVQFVVSCDGTTNTLAALHRRMRQVTRDEAGNITDTGEEVTTTYKLSDFAPAVQTALTNFINVIDNKA